VEEIILLLYLRDEEYGKRLLRFLSGKKNPGVYLELVTARKRVENRVGTEKQKVVILTDYQEIEEDEKRTVIYLCSEQNREKNRIFQYQKAEGIYQELVKLLSLENTESKEKEGGGKNGVYCVFSPEGMGSTLISVMLSQYLGNYGKCLYVSLSGFPLFYEEELKVEPNFSERGLGELLFSVEQEGFVELEQEIRQRFGNGYFISPMAHFKDTLDCRVSEWQLFLKRLQEECGYNSVVVEMGQIFEHTLDFLEQGDRVFILQGQGICGRIRSAVFRRYCQMENKEELEKKSQYIQFPWEIYEWEQEFSQQRVEEIVENQQKMAFVEQLMEQTGGEEDICIIEDFT